MGEYWSCKYANPMGLLTFCICNAVCEDVFLAQRINPKQCGKCRYFVKRKEKKR